MWLLINSLPIWQKYAFYLLLVITLVGCATPANDDYPMERDPYNKVYQETGFPYYGNNHSCNTIDEEEYEAEKRAQEAERNNQPHVNTSHDCGTQNSCKQFKPR
jgi:hypothetical protein